MKSVDMKWVKEHINDINILDVRTPSEYNKGHIPGSLNVPMLGLIMNHQSFLKPEETYYVLCATGGRSAMVISELSPQGYDLVNIDGGIEKY